MPLVGRWILYKRCAHYILFFMFVGQDSIVGIASPVVAFTTYLCLALRLKKVQSSTYTPSAGLLWGEIYSLLFFFFYLFGAGQHGSYSDSSTSWMVLGSNLGRDKRFFSPPKHSDQLWGPPSLLYKGTWFLSVD